MEWQMSYDEAEHIIFIETSGVLDIDSATIMRNEGSMLIKKHHCMRCLLDHSNLSGDALATLDIYNLPKRYAELGIPHQFRMALVVPERFATNLKFYETVCRNNGYQASVFFDRPSALAWLKT